MIRVTSGVSISSGVKARYRYVFCDTLREALRVIFELGSKVLLYQTEITYSEQNSSFLVRMDYERSTEVNEDGR